VRDTVAKVSPSVLASLLQRHPQFRETGYMMPNEPDSVF